jgi:hypothetical protein
MACGCNKSQKNLKLVRYQAIQFSKATKQDVQLFTTLTPHLGIIYKFSHIIPNTKNLIEIIKYEP